MKRKIPKSAKELELMGTEEAVARILQHTTDEAMISMFSDLDQQEINNLVIAMVVSDYLKKELKVRALSDMIKNYLKLKVSLERKGRKEVVGMITLYNLFEQGGKKSAKLSDLFAGM